MAVERDRGQNRGTWIKPLRRLAIYLRDRFRCVYCLVDLSGAEPRFITLDHVKPPANGGTHESANLVTACLSCNSSRRDQPVRAWRPDAVDRVRNACRRVVPTELARRRLAETAAASREDDDG